MCNHGQKLLLRLWTVLLLVGNSASLTCWIRWSAHRPGHTAHNMVHLVSGTSHCISALPARSVAQTFCTVFAWSILLLES